MKKIFFAAILGLLLFSTQARSEIQTMRLWTYTGLNLEFTPNWSFTLMPGFKHEFSRNYGAPAGTFLYEFFAGPVFSLKTGNVLIRIPLWYYYLGFPNSQTGAYSGNQNIAFIPEVKIFHERWTFSFRLFFHNTFYSEYYRTESQRTGYSLLLTEKFDIAFKLTDWLSVIIADELFTGIIPDPEAPATAGIGFYRTGLTKNKLYAGFMWSPSGNTKVFTQYVMESSFSEAMQLVQTDHQVYLIFSYSVKFYDNKPI